MRLFIGFDIVRKSNNRYGADLFATDAAGNTIGESVPIIDAIYQSPHEVADLLVGGFRGLARNRIIGFEGDELKIKDKFALLDGYTNVKG